VDAVVSDEDGFGVPVVLVAEVQFDERACGFGDEGDDLAGGLDDLPWRGVSSGRT
jgi:hypothetical protein